MKHDFSDSNAPLPRRRLLQLTAMGALAIATSNGSRQAFGAAPGAEETQTSPENMPIAPHEFGLRAVPPRRPLAPSPFIALPLGSVKARGWLLHQLELQRDGLTGHAEEVLPATAPNSAWKGGDGEDWEKGPYYLKGLISLAYTLDDANLKDKVKAWVEPILASVREDGFFGPKKNDDWWPRMVVTYLLRDYAEATGDARIAPFLTNYYRHMSAALPTRPLDSWGRARAGDEIDTVLWLYNRTGDDFLLSLADLLEQQAYPWRQIFTENLFLDFNDDFHPTHNVNVPQALKMPVVYSQRSGKGEDKAAYRAGVTHLMQDHGTPFGINTGAERLSGRSSVEGVELCSIVEHMLSTETAMRILGEARLGDELETLAFNALPAAFSKDFRQHVYYTISNNVAAVRGSVGYTDDHGDDRAPAPRSGFPCCCYNLHMGWPKLAQNAWAATPAGGLAVLAYVPSQVSAIVVGEQTATLVCDTNYPFEDTIRLSVKLAQVAKFPLQLRIPAWCKNPQIKVNGSVQPKAAPGTFATLDRIWKNDDRVEITFPMSVEVVRGINDSVSVRRGPLVYALGLKENWAAVEKNKVEGFESYEVTTDSPWNFGLVLDAANPADSFQVVSKKAGANPFETGNAPIALRVQGKRLDGWTIRFDGRLPHEPPLSPIASISPGQALELVPFGSQMLRISEFPVIGTPPAPLVTWSEDFTGDYSQRWLVHRGSFMRDGQLRLPKAAKGIASRAVFADFVYDADVVVGDNGDAGIIFRVSNASVGTDHYLGYYVGINAEANVVTFGKSNNTWLPAAYKPKSIEAGHTHHLRVEARGPQIRVWVDDMETPIIEARDDTFTSGTLGIRSYSNKAAFGKLSARAI
ncbi:hypothetical protein IAD21_01676 [Abditibacteriota bacterium]|nr:hypothetical protein IAD21_01676 [Abditibacteriota bacterium]